MRQPRIRRHRKRQLAEIGGEGDLERGGLLNALGLGTYHDRRQGAAVPLPVHDGRLLVRRCHAHTVALATVEIDLTKPAAVGSGARVIGRAADNHAEQAVVGGLGGRIRAGGVGGVARVRAPEVAVARGDAEGELRT